VGAGSSSDGPTRAVVRRLAVARLVSVSGSQAAQIALVYEVYERTKSGAWVVAALIASMTVNGLMGPASGWVADRFDRRRVMIASELAGGAAYAVLALAHAPVLLIAGVFAATVLGAPFRAASSAGGPNIVDAGTLAWANGLLQTAFNVGLVAGPLVGGAIVASSGAGAVFVVNAGSFLASGLLIAITRRDFGGRNRERSLRADGDPHPLLLGFSVIARSDLLRSLTAAHSCALGAFGAALVIDPALADQFGAGSVGYGLLTTVWGGGAVVGALVAGRIITLPRAPAAVVWGMAAMAVSLGSIAVLPSFALIVATGATGGAGSGFVFVPVLSLIQHHTEDRARGRVIAAAESCEQVAFLIGMGVAAPAISIFRPQHVYALTGGALVLATLFAIRAAATADRALEPAVVPAGTG
jgi:ENTS family enterobactin (siderophore) exporter